jgi:hypothetical protein
VLNLGHLQAQFLPYKWESNFKMKYNFFSPQYSVAVQSLQINHLQHGQNIRNTIIVVKWLGCGSVGSGRGEEQQ